MCVRMGFCSTSIGDTNYSTTPNTVIDFEIHEGNGWYMKESGKQLFTSEQK
jgi:hypothetical protein